MNKNKILLIGDQHIGCRNGSEAWRKYMKAYLLEYVISYCVENDIQDIISLGDFYDVRRSLLGEDMWWLVTEFIPLLAEHKITYHIIQGNHTQIRRDSNLLNWDEWLQRESIAHGSCCVKAYSKPQDLTIGETTFALLPWVNRDSHDLTVEYIKKTEATIALGHLELEGFVMTGSSLCKHGTLDRKLLSKFDEVYVGHFHQSSSSGNIKYLGTPYELTWADYEAPTDNGIYTFDTLTQKLEFIPNEKERSMFREIEYNYEKLASKRLGKKYLDVDYLNDELGLRDSVIRVIVTDRSNSSHWKKFNETLRSVDCVNYSTVDQTHKIEIEEQEVTAEGFKLNTLDILLNKINSTESEDESFRYEAVGNKLKKVYSKCVDNSNLV